MRAALIPLLAFTVLTAASAEPVPAGYERVAVINLQLSGEPKFETVVLPSPPQPSLMLHVCIREYDAPAIRCYALDTSNRTSPEWLTMDLELKK